MLRTRLDDARATGASARLWAEIDLDAVAHNVRALRRRLRPGCRLIAVVKANGYGHGAEMVAGTALRAGVAEFAVGDVAEGVRLRRAGIDAPILIVGPSAPADAAAIVAHRLVPALGGVELLAPLAASARARGVGVCPIELEIDTGMRRHGVDPADVGAFAAALRLHPSLRLAGVFTHFAGLGAGDRSQLDRQHDAFLAAATTLAAIGHAPRRHACNTLATLLLPSAHDDAVRIGGGLYGFDPGVPGAPPLRPALSLRTRIAALRQAAAGACVGYGGSHTCAADTALALLPCGYADGLSRAHWDGAPVLVGGRRCRVAGHVSMNQMVVDLGAGSPPVAVGDEVVLLGSHAGAGAAADRLRPEPLAAAGCSPYEVTSLLRADMPRAAQRIASARS